METYVLKNDRYANNPFARRIGDLIANVGSSCFDSSLFQIAREATTCQHLTVFASSDRAPPRLSCAINCGPQPTARIVSERYLKLYWHHDPANLICDRTTSSSYQIGLLMSDRDIDHDDYRYDCYSSIGLVDRFSIIRHHNAETIRLNLYRSAECGRFAATDLSSILESADVLLALVAKHDSWRLSAEQRDAADVFAQRLIRIMPQLAARELDVCIGIMQGRSSEAIALALGVSINTVLTYRKRAYARLGITSQNELMRMVLT